MKAKISEIFKSIQGEGIYQGVAQVFVRFFGCNLHCCFCDTQLSSYEDMDLAPVIDRIREYQDYHSVAITGGEPLLQKDFLKGLLTALKREEIKVYLETNGTLPENLKEVIEFVDIIAMDFKLPSSTQSGSFWLEHKEFLAAARQREVFIKAVITRDTRLEDIYKAIELIKEVKASAPFVLQPCNPDEVLLEDKLEVLRAVCESNEIKVKVIPQQHKVLGIK